MENQISRRNATFRIATSLTAGGLGLGILDGHRLTCAADQQAAVPSEAKESPGKKPADFQLNYILASSMYGKMPLADILPEVAKTGAQQIDIWPRVHADQREQMEKMGHDRFAQLLRDHRVGLGMVTRYDLGPFKLQPEMKVLNKFGGRLIICGGKNTPGKTLRDQVAAFVKQLQPHLDTARRLGITLGIENHANNLINTPDSLRYLAEFAPDNLGVALAPYHLPQDEKLLSKLIEDLGPKMVHFYAWQHGMGCHKKLPKEQEMLQMPGLGKLDFRPLLAAMKKVGFAGWTEVFMHPVPRGIPILDTTAQVTAAINRSRDYLARCLKA